MSRYFTSRRRSRAEQEWLAGEPMRLTWLDVPEHEARDTGIIDQRGNPIMCAPNPMGFVWKDGE